MLGGGTGHVFGNNPIWLFGDGWEDALDSPGSQAMTHLADLFLSRAWFRLQPDLTGSVLTFGAGQRRRGALTSDGESILVYVPGSKTVAIRTTGIANSQARAWWFDPKNGNSSLIGLVPTTGTVNFAFSGGKVLVVDNAATESASAGQPAVCHPRARLHVAARGRRGSARVALAPALAREALSRWSARLAAASRAARTPAPSCARRSA